MKEGKDLILATKKFAVEDKKRSWFHTITAFVLLISSFVAGVLADNTFVKIGIGLLSGLSITRVFVIYHDYLHKAILPTSKLAYFMFYVFGLFKLAPFSIWKRSHDYHHKHNSKLYTSSIGSFPIVTLEKFKKAPKSEQRKYLFIRHPITISLGYIFAFVYGMSIKSLIASPSKHWDSALALTFHFGLAFLVYYNFGFETVMLSYFFPVFISGGLGSYLFYAQHNFPGVVFKEKEDWSYSEAALKSSSMMVMNPVMQWFTANIGFHQIHHMNAKIPFYKLPEVYNEFKEFQTATKTSLMPWDIWACFRLKVWDTERGQMIGLKEAGLR
ncbi:MAG: fatty acid desaturase [Vicingaceae bacterium]